MPNGLGFGLELEVSRGANRTLEALRNEGATKHTSFHRYHCSCDECEPFDSTTLFHAQQDCTADGEFISKVLTYGSKRADRAFQSLQNALVEGGASVSGEVGMHVHVRRPQDRRQTATDIRLARLFTRYADDLDQFAAASFSEVRGYNSKNRATRDLMTVKPWRYQRAARLDGFYGYRSNGTVDCRAIDRLTNGSWLSYGDTGETYEFRLWNATTSAWRMALHVGLSVGMTRAAMYGNDNLDLTVSFRECLSPWLDDKTQASIDRQINYREAQGF